MGVAKYIKDEKGAIKEVTYQSGIKVKPSYGPEDLEKAGLDHKAVYWIWNACRDQRTV